MSMGIHTYIYICIQQQIAVMVRGGTLSPSATRICRPDTRSLDGFLKCDCPNP